MRSARWGSFTVHRRRWADIPEGRGAAPAGHLASVPGRSAGPGCRDSCWNRWQAAQHGSMEACSMPSAMPVLARRCCPLKSAAMQQLVPSLALRLRPRATPQCYTCAGCGRPTVRAKRCSACRSAHYCSTACQRGHGGATRRAPSAGGTACQRGIRLAEPSALLHSCRSPQDPPQRRTHSNHLLRHAARPGFPSASPPLPAFLPACCPLPPVDPFQRCSSRPQ